MQAIDYDLIGIAEVLSRFRLRVPVNQREYAWEEAHVTDLLTDVGKAMRKRREAYFLGTIVLTGSGDTSEVADGQQRLATTTMVLTAIRDYFLELGDEQRAQAIETKFLFEIDIDSRDRLPKLILNADDRAYFLSRILARPTERADGVAASRGSHELLSSAFGVIRQHLGRLRESYGPAGFPDALLEWRRYLLGSATAMVLRVPSARDAFVMFETLNDRGRKTSESDLVKNHLFAECENQLIVAQQYWSAMRGAVESTGEQEATMDFLRFACCLKFGPTRSREVFDKIEEDGRGETEAIRLLHELDKMAQEYPAILNPEHAKWNKYAPEIRTAIATLNLLEVSQLRPLLLSVAIHFSPHQAAMAFARFVAWSVRFIITGGGRGGKLDTFYATLARDIHARQVKTMNDLDERSKGVVPTDAQFKDAFSNVRISKAKLARFILRSLERVVEEHPHPGWVPDSETSVVNLEHIMPQAPSEEWPEVTDQDRETHADRLGNLVLLDPASNVKIDRKNFEVKRAVFKESNFTFTQHVADVQKWGKKEIDDRQATLSEFAVRAWSID